MGPQKFLQFFYKPKTLKNKVYQSLKIFKCRVNNKKKKTKFLKWVLGSVLGILSCVFQYFPPRSGLHGEDKMECENKQRMSKNVMLKWQPTPVFLPGESQGWEPGGLPSMGSHRVGHD